MAPSARLDHGLAAPRVASRRVTDEGIREVPLDQVTVEVLREHRERRSSRGRTADRSDPRGISQAFEVRRSKAGLPKIRLHDVRHSAAMLSMDDNVHPELLRRRLGHSRIQLTIDLYMKGRADEAERGVADSLAARIAAPTARCERLAWRGLRRMRNPRKPHVCRAFLMASALTHDNVRTSAFLLLRQGRRLDERAPTTRPERVEPTSQVPIRHREHGCPRDCERRLGRWPIGRDAAPR
jgi:hypothetical protein